MLWWPDGTGSQTNLWHPNPGHPPQGGIVLSEPLPFPEGAEVIVQIKSVHPTPPPSAEDFASLPFFGLWADRTDLPASEAWVRERRDARRRRAIRPD